MERIKITSGNLFGLWQGETYEARKLEVWTVFCAGVGNESEFRDERIPPASATNLTQRVQLPSDVVIHWRRNLAVRLDADLLQHREIRNGAARFEPIKTVVPND